MNEVVQHKSNTASGVVFSKTATEHLLRCLAEHKNSRGVRLSLKKTGCSGWSYVLDYDDEAHDDDVICELTKEYFIYIDKKSYPYLKGLSVDYVQQGINRKLVFTNPNQTGQCGCGESFSVD